MPALAEPRSIFERGDHLYLTMPVQIFTPSQAQIEEFALSSQVKKSAPNENIVWFQGSYVEADNANANGAMWKADELAIKSLTPMLMPVTVMHDPRTAVGTIADVKLLTPEKDQVPRSRIDTVLALWGHRFPDAVREAEVNATAGTLMQSMECYSPSYECSVCGSVYHKLPHSAEQAQWCAHLKTSNPSAGYVDLGATGQSSNASRILLGVCFTGTGLIFGTRGARGAYSGAHLNSFQDELASYHQGVHQSTSTQPRSVRMGLVNIEESELATLRKERDDAKAEAAKVPTLMQEKATAETAAEQAEAAKTAAEAERDTVKAQLTAATETAAKAELKEKRWGQLGDQFVAKLGDFTKAKLQKEAAALEDTAWDERLQELEELTAVKRDAKKEGGTDAGAAAGRTLLDPPDFKPEEAAAAQVTRPTVQDAVDRIEQANVIGKLGGIFAGASK